MSTSAVAIASICVTILIAVIGWIFTYHQSRASATRSAQLDRVNKQLRELYGPLYARLSASNRVWEAFWENYRPAHGENFYFGEGVSLTDKELEIWRTWMRTVFEPMNAATEEILLENVDLLESDEIPDAFVDALAHIAAYRAVLDAWERGDFSEHTSVNNWPYEDLHAVVEPELKRLRKRQRELLGA